MSLHNQAREQIAHIERFANLEQQLCEVPVTMPPDRIAAAGSEAHIFVGLGVVGLWAVIDAYCERKWQKKVKVKGKLSGDLQTRWSEIDDMRNLYAHNFAGVADSPYWQCPNGNARSRGVFQKGIRYDLAGGGWFDGERIYASIDVLKAYIAAAHCIIDALGRTP